MDNAPDIVGILSLIVTVLALIYTAYSFKKQLQLSFFADYTKRYQEIIMNLPEEIHDEQFKISEQNLEIKSLILKYMRAYFDLCSEEYFLSENSNLDKKTWKEWKTGIEFAFSKPAFIEAWKLLNFNTVYYKNFSDFVSELTEKNT